MSNKGLFGQSHYDTGVDIFRNGPIINAVKPVIPPITIQQVVLPQPTPQQRPAITPQQRPAITPIRTPDNLPVSKPLQLMLPLPIKFTDHDLILPEPLNKSKSNFPYVLPPTFPPEKSSYNPTYKPTYNPTYNFPQKQTHDSFLNVIFCIAKIKIEKMISASVQATDLIMTEQDKIYKKIINEISTDKSSKTITDFLKTNILQNYNSDKLPVSLRNKYYDLMVAINKNTLDLNSLQLASDTSSNVVEVEDLISAIQNMSSKNTDTESLVKKLKQFSNTVSSKIFINKLPILPVPIVQAKETIPEPKQPSLDTGLSWANEGAFWNESSLPKDPWQSSWQTDSWQYEMKPINDKPLVIVPEKKIDIPKIQPEKNKTEDKPKVPEVDLLKHLNNLLKAPAVTIPAATLKNILIVPKDLTVTIPRSKVNQPESKIEVLGKEKPGPITNLLLASEQIQSSWDKFLYKYKKEDFINIVDNKKYTKAVETICKDLNAEIFDNITNLRFFGLTRDERINYILNFGKMIPSSKLFREYNKQIFIPEDFYKYYENGIISNIDILSKIRNIYNNELILCMEFLNTTSTGINFTDEITIHKKFLDRFTKFLDPKDLSGGANHALMNDVIAEMNDNQTRDITKSIKGFEIKGYGKFLNSQMPYSDTKFFHKKTLTNEEYEQATTNAKLEAYKNPASFLCWVFIGNDIHTNDPDGDFDDTLDDVVEMLIGGSCSKNVIKTSTTILNSDFLHVYTLMNTLIPTTLNLENEIVCTKIYDALYRFYKVYEQYSKTQKKQSYNVQEKLKTVNFTKLRKDLELITFFKSINTLKLSTLNQSQKIIYYLLKHYFRNNILDMKSVDNNFTNIFNEIKNMYDDQNFSVTVPSDISKTLIDAFKDFTTFKNLNSKLQKL